MWLDPKTGFAPSNATPGTTRAYLYALPEGRAGVRDTLKAMRRFVLEAVREPTQIIRERTLAILREFQVPSRAWFGEIRACQLWIQLNVRYTRDPYDVELVQTPFKTLEYGAGDCDDQSCLLASFLHAIGHPTRFAALGFNNGPLSHVLCQAKVGNTGRDSEDWITAETINPKPLGWYPPGVTSQYILKV